ncbi:MAG: hypothetical protein ACFE8T_07490 [Promethearchaeota archaeon]
MIIKNVSLLRCSIIKILKIIDGFITNSSTETTTILLAVPKDKNLYEIFEKIGFSGNYPLDFFEFYTDQSQVEEFLNDYQVNLAYLRKEYNLFYNIIQNNGPECETMNDELYRFHLVLQMVEEIKSKASNDIVILDYGDLLHDGFNIKPVPIYTKEEVVNSFKSNNKVVIKSLIDNSIVDKLDLEDEELKELAGYVDIPLVELIDKPRSEFELIRFEPRYYKIFGDKYLEALIEAEELYHKERPHSSPEMKLVCPWEIDSFSAKILKAKIKGTLPELVFDNKIEFLWAISEIHSYFGSEALIKFLSNTPNFSLLKRIREFGIEESFYDSCFYVIAVSIAEGVKSQKQEIQDLAYSIHQKYMEVLKIYMLEQPFDDRIMKVIIPHIIHLYIQKNQLPLICQMLHSVPKERLDMILEGRALKQSKASILQELSTY